MSQLNAVTHYINAGYTEISESESPIQCSDRDSLYFHKDNYYLIVRSDGNFLSWYHPIETEMAKKRWRYYLK